MMQMFPGKFMSISVLACTITPASMVTRTLIIHKITRFLTFQNCVCFPLIFPSRKSRLLTGLLRPALPSIRPLGVSCGFHMRLASKIPQRDSKLSHKTNLQRELFLDFFRAEKPEVSCENLSDSKNGHWFHSTGFLLFRRDFENTNHCI